MNSLGNVTCCFSKQYQVTKSLSIHNMRIGNRDEITRRFCIRRNSQKDCKYIGTTIQIWYLEWIAGRMWFDPSQKQYQLPKSLLAHKMRFGNRDEITRQFIISSEVSKRLWFNRDNDWHLLFEINGLRNFPCSFSNINSAKVSKLNKFDLKIVME